MRRLIIVAMLLAPAAAAGDRQPVAYTVVDASTIPARLGGAPGDAARGAAVAADPARGGCLGCHGAGAAPALGPLAARLPEGARRLAVVNGGVRDAGLAGHAFYDIAAADESGTPPETRLTAREVEDVVAWLATLGD